MSKYKEEIFDAYNEIKEAGFPINIIAAGSFNEATETYVDGPEFSTYAVKIDSEEEFRFEAISAEDLILIIPGYKIPFALDNNCKIENDITKTTRSVYRVKSISPEDNAVIVYIVLLKAKTS
jgi:bacillopeptidase F (M6 metalloprotease family)